MDSIKRRAASGTLSECLRLLKGSRIEYLSLAFLSSLVAALGGIAHPLLVKVVFDAIISRVPLHRFLLIAAGYLALGVFTNASSTFLSLWSKSLENRIFRKASAQTLEAYFRKDYAHVVQQGSGYFIHRVYGDLKDGLLPMLELGISFAKDAALLVGLSAVLVYLSWRASLYLFVLVPISVALAVTFGKRIKNLSSHEREQEGRVHAVLGKVLTSFRIVVGFSLLPSTSRLVDMNLLEYLRAGYKNTAAKQVFQSLNDLGMVLADFISLLVGTLFVFNGTLSFGGFIAFVNAFWRTVTTAIQLFKRMADYSTFGVSISRVMEFIAPSEGKYFTRGKTVAARDLRFAYGAAPLLRDLSFTLSARERIVIVGGNGSGKTTLANILAGFLAPNCGELTLPERISAITLPILFPPIRVADLISDTHLLNCLGLRRPSVLHELADELSAGQQQKVALALALSRNADLYIIDEPLANVDAESRREVINAILERTEDKMLILIMHGGEEYYSCFDRVVHMGDLDPLQREEVIVRSHLDDMLSSRTFSEKAI